MVELLCCPSTQVNIIILNWLLGPTPGLVAKKTRAVYLTCYGGDFGIEDGVIVQTMADYHCATSVTSLGLGCTLSLFCVHKMVIR